MHAPDRRRTMAARRKPPKWCATIALQHGVWRAGDGASVCVCACVRARVLTARGAPGGADDGRGEGVGDSRIEGGGVGGGGVVTDPLPFRGEERDLAACCLVAAERGLWVTTAPLRVSLGAMRQAALPLP